jgi:serine/threonine protein kinase
MYQILSAVEHMHTNWVIHRDIKPSNVMVFMNLPEMGRVQLGDFGLARHFKDTLTEMGPDNQVCTLWYRAPELLLGATSYSIAIDIWSIGCVFAEMLTSQPLFVSREPQQSEHLRTFSHNLFIHLHGFWNTIFVCLFACLFATLLDL